MFPKFTILPCEDTLMIGQKRQGTLGLITFCSGANTWRSLPHLFDMFDILFTQSCYRFKYLLSIVKHLCVNYVKSSFILSNTCQTPLVARILIRTNVRVFDNFSFATFRCQTPLKVLSNTFYLRSGRSWFFLCQTRQTPVGETSQYFGEP